MSRDSIIVKFRAVLFEDMDELSLSDLERTQLTRIRAVYTLQLDNPTISNKEIVSMLQRDFHVKTVAQAYRIIAQTSLLLGSVPNASKQWTRFLVVESLKSVIASADAIIENNADDDVRVKALDAKIKAADRLAKYTRLDKVDPESIPFEDITMLKTEFVTDPSVMNVKVDNPYEFVERVKGKYIDFEEVADG